MGIAAKTKKKGWVRLVLVDISGYAISIERDPENLQGAIISTSDCENGLRLPAERLTNIIDALEKLKEDCLSG
ncbi:MAG: hypothetical protein JRJ31_16885 [Deltaproteobacteria bacterium]|nr:hypothetical protein [Deltaproteobacteria bacterium]